MTRRRLAYLAGVLSVCLLGSGCGPGFPIVTAEQEALIDNVDTLMKENAELKGRVSALEAGGISEVGAMKTQMDELRFSIADTNSRLDDLRRELSFVQGSVQEFDHRAGQLAADMKTVSTTVDTIGARISNLESTAQSMLDTYKSFERTAAEAAPGKDAAEGISALQARLDTLDGRLSSIEAAMAADSKAAVEDPEAVYHKAYQKILDNDFEGAEKAFRAFLKENPKHKLAENAQYWLAESYYSRGDWQRSILEFDKVIKGWPKGDKTAAALLKQGFGFDKLGSKKESRVLLEQVVEKYPKSDEAELARKRLKTFE